MYYVSMIKKILIKLTTKFLSYFDNEMLKIIW